VIEWQRKRVKNHTARASTRISKFGRNTKAGKWRGDGVLDAELVSCWLNTRIG
jgi:hypothetical protein